MLSSSRAKIHEPIVTGVSPRPTDQRQRQKLRNTRYSVGAENRVTSSDQHLSAGGRNERRTRSWTHSSQPGPIARAGGGQIVAGTAAAATSGIRAGRYSTADRFSLPRVGDGGGPRPGGWSGGPRQPGPSGKRGATCSGPAARLMRSRRWSTLTKPDLPDPSEGSRAYQ
jgi:hypothetical protein